MSLYEDDPNMIKPPITLHNADIIQRDMKNLLLSFTPNIREMLKRMLKRQITTLANFSVVDSKRYNDAPMVATLIVNKITPTASTALCKL